MTGQPLLYNLIGGQPIARRSFPSPSLFYPEYQVATPQAGELDVSRAIGAARRAERMAFAERARALLRAAEAFHAPLSVIEHTVRVTGIPRRVVESLVADIPRWLSQIPDAYAGKLIDSAPFDRTAQDQEMPQVIYQPPNGFAYALCPATDPRAAALVAGNLGALGIPFILKASRQDALAPLVLQALIAGGFDPNFCSLLYFDNRDESAPGKHHKLLQASQVVWTFGPRAGLFPALGLELPSQPGKLPELLQGKVTLFHEDAACAALVGGEFTPATEAFLAESLAFASGCTAVRGVFLVDAAQDWLARGRDWLANLTVGDPLDPATQVGYFHPTNLEALERTVQQHRHDLQQYGGQRLSAHQLQPLLVELDQPVPELLGQEIPAFFLAALRCQSFEQALDLLDRTALQPPRLTVATHGLELSPAQVQRLAGVQTRYIYLDQPTSRVIPHFHEGNDYLRRLCRPRLLAV